MLATSISTYVTTASDATWAIMNTNMKSAFNIRFNSGYDDGIDAADCRINESSASYTAGFEAGYSSGGGIKESEIIEKGASASDWAIANAACTKRCSAGIWIISITATGDSPSSMYTSCSHVTDIIVSVKGKYAGAGTYLVELTTDTDVTASGVALSDDYYTAYVTATAAFIKIK